MPESTDEKLLADLGIEVEPEQQAARSPREERIIAGFEEIQRFVEENGRSPTHGDDKDIFERLYAVRLERLCRLDESDTLLKLLDHQGFLAGEITASETDEAEELDDAALLAELGIDAAPAEDDIENLRHVKTRAEVRAAEEVGKRKPCEDFEIYKPLFAGVVKDIKSGNRRTIAFRKNAGFTKTDIKEKQFIILEGQTCFIAEIGEPLTAPNGEYDARLRVIYDNGTESDILLRTLIRAMYRDDACRLISDPETGPLFGSDAAADDQASGIIYVLRSKSDHPVVAANRDIIHKIGVTNSSVKQRIAGARLDPTFLMADVEVVATYELFNINRTKLETLLHRVFAAAQLDIEIEDRFGKPIKPREWFLVPFNAIETAVDRLKDRSLVNYVYEPEIAQLKLRKTD
ncbi:MAG: hypothetical protein CMM53_10625 [Rhodospirillaceae bacterium]|nr:hypothetical protein [Rhodospirillaceae bacterium]|tara:strand:- start:509 stop:1720 length:1212 start_codon:yes stop_codon:yes gene_type:complete